MQTTVVIPTHNRRHLIGRAIDSVLAQKGVSGIEIIVVDDGSTDGTLEWIREQYPFSSPPIFNLQPSIHPPSTLRHSPCLRLFRQANAGPSAARNLGIVTATGDFIAFLDSDDEWTPDSLAVRVRVLEANPDVDLVCGNFVHCVDGRQVGFTEYERLELLHKNRHRPGSAGAWILEDFFDAQLRCPISLTSALCLRRCALRDCNRFDDALPPHEDWEFCLRFSRDHVVAVTMPVAVRRHVHGHNLARDPAFSGRSILVDRTVLAYSNLTEDQRKFMQARLADDLYEHARRLFWWHRTRLPALRTLLDSMRYGWTGPKCKLLLSCCLPHGLAHRLRKHDPAFPDTPPPN